MAIQIVHRDGRDCPVVVCDCCKLDIENADDAHAIWLSSPRHEEGYHFDVGHVHRACADSFQSVRRAPEGSLWRWQDLNHHLALLLPTCRYDEQKGRQTQSFLDDLQSSGDGLTSGS